MWPRTAYNVISLNSHASFPYSEDKYNVILDGTTGHGLNKGAGVKQARIT
jgi:hypothetical protein